MHELAICEAIVDSAERHARGRPVGVVTVRIGHLRQVVPDALAFAWDMVTAGTALAGAALEIEHVEARVECRSCGRCTALSDPYPLCGSCGSADVEVVAGEELLVVSLELAGV